MGKYDYSAKDLCKAPEESLTMKVMATVSFIVFTICVALVGGL
jgi:hypothetical protein